MTTTQAMFVMFVCVVMLSTSQVYVAWYTMNLQEQTRIQVQQKWQAHCDEWDALYGTNRIKQYQELMYCK